MISYYKIYICSFSLCLVKGDEEGLAALYFLGSDSQMVSRYAYLEDFVYHYILADAAATVIFMSSVSIAMCAHMCMCRCPGWRPGHETTAAMVQLRRVPMTGGVGLAPAFHPLTQQLNCSLALSEQASICLCCPVTFLQLTLRHAAHYIIVIF